jgi:hypothetical protein
VKVTGSITAGQRVVQTKAVLASAGGIRRLVIGVQVSHLIRLRYADLGHRPVDVGRLSSVEVHSALGAVIRLRGSALNSPLWLPGNRIVPTAGGLASKPLEYRVASVISEGGQLVYRGQQGFTPDASNEWRIDLLFYQVRILAHDAIFGGPVGAYVEMTRPDGVTVRVPFTAGHVAVLSSLPRGAYSFKVGARGAAIPHPATISRDQTIALPIITVADMLAVAGGFLLGALALLAAGSPSFRTWLGTVFRRAAIRVGGMATRRQPAHRRTKRPANKGATLLMVAVVSLGGIMAAAPSARAATSPATAAGTTNTQPYPVFAYYYIWYNASSWNRAKTDYPAYGRYSSDDVTVMREQIRAARSAGITGFLVSWKHTPVLDRRLELLANVAREERFNLGVVYQGLDFHRKPLPAAQVLDGLRYLADAHGADSAFASFGKPLVIWTGTGLLPAADVRAVTSKVRGQLLVLASAKTVKDYDRVASVVDGNAYYWSSVSPTNPRYPAKLAEMSSAVHAHGGLWIAPAAAGFDARLIGGHTVIDRRDGQTLRLELNVARRSAPDAIGLISWNEYSENSHIEPSRKYGDTTLKALRAALTTSVTTADSPDSSSADGTTSGLRPLALAAALVALAGLLAFTPRLLRRRRARQVLP